MQRLLRIRKTLIDDHNIICMIKELNFHPFLTNLASLIEVIGTSKFSIVKCDKESIAVSSISVCNKYPITFVFWNQSIRFSFFILNTEIIDEYIESIEQSKELYKTVKSILENKVIKNTYYKKSGTKIKEVIHYQIIIQHELKVVNQKAVYSYKFPWESRKVTEELYDCWI